MKHIRSVFLALAVPALVRSALLLLFALTTARLGGSEVASFKTFFPLMPGTRWVYRGTVEWGGAGAEKPDSTKVSITMSVVRVIEKGDLRIALITGFPSDLAWAEGNVEPKLSLLIETKKHEVILESMPPDFDFQKIERGEYSLNALLAEDNLLFRWPMQKGQKFCPPDSRDRDDTMYCWYVYDSDQTDLSKIDGSPWKKADAFLIGYLTHPDSTFLEIVPDLGVTHYEYRHHGTIANTFLHLVEFHPAADSASGSGGKP